MAKIKVGDRVSVTGKCDGKVFNGHLGRVITNNKILGVEFDNYIDGHSCTGSGKDGHCWGVPESMCTLDTSRSIHIYSNGNTTTAILKNGKETIKTAISKYNPNDASQGLPYSFKKGAEIAMERLFKEPQKQFAPHLESRGEHYGNIGDDTNLVDALGNKLKVGDTVLLYHHGAKKSDRECPIVFAETAANGKKPFVMGIEALCNTSGTISSGYQIIKERGYKEIPDGCYLKSIKYVKS